jgi:hypothetical protein
MTFEENEGPTKCDPSDDHIIDSGTWAWRENETKIVVDSITGTVNKLDETTLQVTAQVNSTTSLRVTYSH